MVYFDEWTEDDFAYRVHPNGEIERGGRHGGATAWSGRILDPLEAWHAQRRRWCAQMEPLAEVALIEGAVVETTISDE